MSLSGFNIVRGIDGEDWIISTGQKTGETIKVPLLSKATQLMEKYKDHPRSATSRTIFPNIPYQKLNAYLKEIGSLCGITKDLTFHLAWHTFATTVTLSNGVPIETVSKMLGHTKITTTQIYARVIEKKIGEDMSVLENKLWVKSMI